ncbi:MAG: cupin domain-containing protein [Agriterribacter sp.]
MKTPFKKYKLNEDVTLQVISYTNELMIARLWFTGRGFNDPHHHINQEANTVLSGKFEATNGSEKTILTAGESVHVYTDLPHNLECLTPTGEIITCWTPARKDIIEKYTEVE